NFELELYTLNILVLKISGIAQYYPPRMSTPLRKQSQLPVLPLQHTQNCNFVSNFKHCESQVSAVLWKKKPPFNYFICACLFQERVPIPQNPTNVTLFTKRRFLGK